METFCVLLAFCTGNSSVTGEFPAQRSVARCFDVFFDLSVPELTANIADAVNLKHHRAHYNVIVMNLWKNSNANACWHIFPF